MEGSRSEKNEPSGADRRRHVRVPADAVPQLSARLVGGPPVRLLDISRRGAQLETSMHLQPGRAVHIRFVAADTVLTLKGAIVRSRVAMLDGEQVTYHAALAFNEDLVVCPDIAATASSPRALPAAPTGAWDESDMSDVFVVVPLPHESGNALRGRLMANAW
jgi:hypothetical protein